ncbi:hypothetical protein E5288_WYG019332 [Bos mutus]|uniref:Homeobox domain-containing protein n=3 Tax=Boreoeutheria TaxID=1437010 RepID=A0A6B0RHV2_9CETA|nr:hypothetical protein [Bos mutus]
MYVGYVLDKDSPVYPGPARPASLSLGPQAYGPPPPPPGPPQYPDFTGYSHVEPGPVPPAAWSAPFSAPKDEWAAAYGPGPTGPTASPAPLAFGPPPDFGAVPTPPGPGPVATSCSSANYGDGRGGSPGACGGQRTGRSPEELPGCILLLRVWGVVLKDQNSFISSKPLLLKYKWTMGLPFELLLPMLRGLYSRLCGPQIWWGEELRTTTGAAGLVTAWGFSNPECKTRTKDKYRVVYTDHQRLELEKEFHYSRYITIRRKSELAANLGLTERQVKIWFQNRRAKERKVNKKKQQQQPPQPPPPAHDITSTPAGPPLAGLCPSSASLLGASSPVPVKEEYLP